MNKSILITGGAGFIGSHIYKKANDNYIPYVIDNFSNNYDLKIKMQNLNLRAIPELNSNIGNIFNMDMLDRDYLNTVVTQISPSIIIHAAALPGIRASMEEPHKYFRENILTTLNLIEIARKNNISKIIFLSSSSVYGDNDVPFTEDMNTRPQSVYAESKNACEELLHMYSMTYNIDLVILRLFTVYGPAQRPDLAIHKFFINAKNKRKSEIYGSLDSFRDYTYIDDTVHGIMLAAEYIENMEGTEIFNIGSQHRIIMRDMISEIEKYIEFPYIIVGKKPGDLDRTLSSTKKAENILHYNASTEFKDGIKKFNEWFNEFYNE